MRFHRLLGLLGILAVACTTLPSAHAAIITLNLFGTVTTAAADNDLGIEAGNALRGSLTFDAALLAGVGEESLTPEADPALTLHFDFAGFQFDAEDDPLFPEFPRFDFRDGKLVDINFVALFSLARGNDFVLALGDGEFNIVSVRDLEIIVEGVFSIAAIPEPMTAALFGLGLASAALLQRRAAARRRDVPLCAGPAR